MINNSDFINRLKKILEHHQLSASGFADRINVQRSSISHILSGRNKPSLDFVLKITNAFTDVDLYWLLNGKGSFPANKQEIQKNQKDAVLKVAPKKEIITPSLFQDAIVEKTTTNTSKKYIEKIIVFYSDGTFEELNK